MSRFTRPLRSGPVGARRVALALIAAQLACSSADPTTATGTTSAAGTGGAPQGTGGAPGAGGEAPIPPEKLSVLFEPLERAVGHVEKLGHSVGLGLHIVRHIVDAHGGTVEARSAATEGTTFPVTLPRVAPPVSARRGSPR